MERQRNPSQVQAIVGRPELNQAIFQVLDCGEVLGTCISYNRRVEKQDISDTNWFQIPGNSDAGKAIDCRN
jgi:hypothetical protein